MKQPKKLRNVIFGALLLILPLLLSPSQTHSQSWEKLIFSDISPAARMNHSAVYDALTNRLIIYGGETGVGDCNTSCILDDVWVLENANGTGGTPNWIQLFPSEPHPIKRVQHSAVYDPSTNCMIVFGGMRTIGYGGDMNDVWVLENANGLDPAGIPVQPMWRQIFTSGAPSTRRLHHAFFDQVSNCMIIFGGYPDKDVWRLEHPTGIGGTPVWTHLSSGAGPINPENLQLAVYDNTHNRLSVLSGYVSPRQLWVFTNANGYESESSLWIQLNQTGIIPSHFHFPAFVFDPVFDQMIICGGASNLALADVWTINNVNGLNGDTSEWIFLDPEPGPQGMDSLKAVFDTDSRRMIMFGGRTGTVGSNNTPTNDVWVLNMSNETEDDTTAPVITTPADITVEAANSSGTIVNFTVTAVDDVDGPLIPSITPASDSIFTLGITTVTCTVTDAAGNTATASFEVTVQDTTPPTITAPADVFGEATGPLTSVDLGIPTVRDVADPNPTYTNDAPAAGFPAGTTTVTWTATDASGNQNTDIQLVTIQASPPQALVAILMANVEFIIDEAGLNRGTSNSLTSKLETALRAIERGRTNTAINQLQAFINQVNALFRSRRLSNDQAETLITAANDIILIL